MIQCPKCKTSYLAGTLFCGKCGTILDADSSTDGKSTDPLSDGPIFQGGPGTAPVRETSAAVETSPDDSIEIPPGSLALWIANSNRRQFFEVDKEILIGRLDSANRIFPDLDLTADGGPEGGISRRHSRITFRDGIPYVEDLKSTNHTYLNGVELESLVPYRLQHQDELRLGSVLLRVEFPHPDTEREG